MVKALFLCLFIVATVRAEDAPAYRELPCRVVDETGQPVRGVAVDDGNYSLRVGARFVDGIWVREGNHHGGIDTDDDDQLLAPGRHDFTLRPKKPGE